MLQGVLHAVQYEVGVCVAGNMCVAVCGAVCVAVRVAVRITHCAIQS